MTEVEYYRNTERLADIDEGALWAKHKGNDDFILVNIDDLRRLGKDWAHVMTLCDKPKDL